MRIGQLKDYLEALISAGIDPNTPVCIHDHFPAHVAIEVSDATLFSGLLMEDPSPQCCAFRPVEGQFLMLQSSVDYDPMLNVIPARYTEIETGVEVPEKSWPNGHWFTEPRRKDGQL
jgi:hypothetical protein